MATVWGAQLDGVCKAIYPENPMKFRFRLFLLLLAGCIAFPERSPAPVVFKPGKKAKYLAPGEEEINGNAQELFKIAEKAESDSNRGRALKAYRTLVRKYPKDTLAAGAAFRAAKILEETGQFLDAAAGYRVIVEKYPKSPNFDESIEAQFRVGEMYLGGKKIKLLGIPYGTSMDRAVEIFAAIVRTAPYGKYTARAQFDIGLAREKQGLNDAALLAYQAVVEKFPNEPIAADAQYQIGYIWFRSARGGTNDAKAAASAKTGFEDFLFRFPKSEKVPQARENLKLLEHKQTNDSFSIARYYDKQKNYRAAVIYYNDVIRQQPGSAEGDKSKKRVEEIRAKIGEAALQPAISVANTAKGKGEKREATSENSQPRDSARTGAPLPPPEADTSLPPPASLMPDTTTAPETSPTPTSSPSESPVAPASTGLLSAPSISEAPASADATPSPSENTEAPASTDATASPTP
jgi:outer membrane protein assembly factor BamD